jgi:hypothetical protein
MPMPMLPLLLPPTDNAMPRLRHIAAAYHADIFATPPPDAEAPLRRQARAAASARAGARMPLSPPLLPRLIRLRLSAADIAAAAAITPLR